MRASAHQFIKLCFEELENRDIGRVNHVADGAVSVVGAVEEVVDDFVVDPLVGGESVVNFDGGGEAHALLGGGLARAFTHDGGVRGRFGAASIHGSGHHHGADAGVLDGEHFGVAGTLGKRN